MIRNFFIFFATFVLGAIAALVVRAVSFDAHAQAADPVPAIDYKPMVSNALTAPTPTATDAKEHSQHKPPHRENTTHQSHDILAEKNTGEAGPAGAVAASEKPVNTICAICGMDVDPSLPTEEYQGKRIGFGCRMCPPKFKANPDKYGPSYLRNERIKR